MKRYQGTQDFVQEHMYPAGNYKFVQEYMYQTRCLPEGRLYWGVLCGTTFQLTVGRNFRGVFYNLGLSAELKQILFSFSLFQFTWVRLRYGSVRLLEVDRTTRWFLFFFPCFYFAGHIPFLDFALAQKGGKAGWIRHCLRRLLPSL